MPIVLRCDAQILGSLQFKGFFRQIRESERVALDLDLDLYLALVADANANAVAILDATGLESLQAPRPGCV